MANRSSGSVAAAYVFGSRSWGLGAAALWTVWTLVALGYGPLIFLQLCSAWGSFVAVDAFTKQSRELESFKRALTNYDNNKQEAFLGARKEGKVTPLVDSDHYSYLLAELDRAESSVLILSGWISDKVVDQGFVSTILRALDRGVTIYLGYGYEDSRGGHQESEPAKRALANLAEIKPTKSRLFVGKFNNHQKILIVDQLRVVCGSHNWLSNRAFKNREKSFIIEDRKAAEETFSQMAPLITANQPTGA